LTKAPGQPGAFLLPVDCDEGKCYGAQPKNDKNQGWFSIHRHPTRLQKISSRKENALRIWLIR
jgi:hypothetical protein